MTKHRQTIEVAKNPVPGDPEKGGGYWINLDTAQTVRQKCSRPVHGVALYFALNLVATDYQSRTIHVTYSHLSQLSGVRLSAIPNLLKELADLGAISIEIVRGISAKVEDLTKITLQGEIRL